ncbi:MAG: hypothetical protein AB8B47_03910 [Roseobacter sp.]
MADMSNMENLETQLNEKERQQQANDAALMAIEAEKKHREASGYAIMSAVMGYGEGAMGNGTFGKVSHTAKLFCIGFAMLVPSLLIWRVLL